MRIDNVYIRKVDSSYEWNSEDLEFEFIVVAKNTEMLKLLSAINDIIPIRNDYFERLIRSYKQNNGKKSINRRNSSDRKSINSRKNDGKNQLKNKIIKGEK